MRNCQKYLFHSLFLSYCQIHLKVESQKNNISLQLNYHIPCTWKKKVTVMVLKHFEFSTCSWSYSN